MVASRLGLAIPQSIALRLIGTNIPAYRSSMSGDIIVEHEPQPSLLTLSARHPIEADIWVRHRLPQSASQFDIIRSLALHIRSDEAVQDDSMELDFVVKLLQAVGPEGDDRFRMRTHYDAIGKIVGELRLRHEVHPRLLLVEAHATREWIKLEQQKKPAPTFIVASERFEVWVSLLDKADQGLRHAIDMVLDAAAGYLSAAARRMLTTLATERAAVLGFKVGSVSRLREHEQTLAPVLAERTDTWLRDARDAWREALRFDDENPRAVDAACWILKERMDCGIADPVAEAELLAEWGDLVDRYLEMDVPPSQLDRLDRAESTFAAACGDVTRFKSVMDRAAARGSNAMHVLIARSMHQKKGAAVARAYLEKECGAVLRTDRAVLLLYLRLWWESETGFDSYLGRERACLAFDQVRWETLEALASARLRLQGEQDHAVTHFLRACALLSLDRVEEANQAFEYLARLGLGGFRRSRSLVLLTTSDGTPRLLTAEFQGRRQAGIWLAWCDELRTNIRFQPLDHGLVDLRPGTWLKPFHLSLSFRGMFAEPPSRLRESRTPERT
jgi:hypothetical protein